MDLPTCPACGQSVLDDEAADCPFCGASMSGKPQATKPTAPVASPKTTDSATTKKGPETKSRESASAERVEKPDEQDPFAVDSTADTKKAIPLRTQPEKGRTHEVICPMCETPGFTSTKAAGREVRCCNSACLVRVFTAPELPQETPVEEPEKSGLSGGVLVGGGILVVALIAVGVWYFGFRQPDDPIVDGPIYVPGQYADSTSVDDASDDSSPPPTVKAKDGEPQTPREIQAAALKKMTAACLRRDNNRSKPYCRRVTAVAFVQAGAVGEAQNQLKQMRMLRPAIPYYEIDPLVEIAWQAHRSGDATGLKNALDSAVKAATRLPSRGRSRLTVAADLAAILVTANRLGEAQALIEKHEESNFEGQLAAQLSAMRSTRRFNADAYAEETRITDYVAPQTVAVVIGLVARGEQKAALQWASSQKNLETRSEATMIWADFSLRHALSTKSTFDIAAVEAAANGLPPAGNARLNARMARRFHQAGRQSDAAASLARAQTALSAVPVPAAVVLPGMKELVSFQLPQAEPLRMAAFAAAETAAAEIQAGNSEKSVAAFKLSMRFLRGSTPSPLAIHSRLNAIGDLGVKAMQAELRKVLKLRTDEEARLAFNDYRKNCTEIAEAADNRFAGQEAVLTFLARVGLADEVSQVVLTRSEEVDANQREPWAISRLPWWLVAHYQSSSNSEAGSRIQALLDAAGARQFPIDSIVNRAEKQLADGKYKEAAEEFEGRVAKQVSDDLRDLWRLRLAGRLTAAGKLDAAFEFIGAIGSSDASFREAALWFTAAQASQAGQSSQVWDLGQHASWTATELVSIYGGLIETLAVADSSETAAAN